MTINELEQCIREYGTDIYSFCRYLTRDSMEADDLYQDTFLFATEHMEKLDETENIKSYLLSAAVHLWQNRLRKRAWRRRIAGEIPLDPENGNSVPEGEKAFSNGNTPEEEVVAAEQKAKIQAAVRRLPEHFRTVVLLFYMQEMSVEEIGRILSIPSGTVKSRLYQARKRLKKLLEAEERQVSK